jgi:DNA processing protein
MTSPAAARRHLIALNSGTHLSRDSICRLALGLAEWVVCSDSGESFAHHLGVPSRDLEKARRLISASRQLLATQVQQSERIGCEILTFLDDRYPQTLLQLELPPPVLYVQGRIPRRPAVAIVGSRKATPAGLETARLFSRKLASCGVAIVSGFARGIDLAAHQGALEAPGGLTLAVLGCGLDIDYPKRRARTRRAIASQGALISEFPLGARPAPLNFPIRNRIIAALAIGTLVVQGTPKSGSLITARQALDLGRDVYAIPGSIFDERSAGPNSLIRDGALLVQSPEEIVQSLPCRVREALAELPQLAIPIPVAAPAGQLLHDLEPALPVTADHLAGSTGMPVDRVHSLLLELEVSGHVRRLPGGLFCRRL